jgi:hypothetical protein
MRRKITLKDRPCSLHPSKGISRVGTAKFQSPGPVSKQVAKDGVPGWSPARARALRNVEACGD